MGHENAGIERCKCGCAYPDHWAHVPDTNRRIVTFSVGGPLRGYYANLWVLDEENDSHEGAEAIIRAWAAEHFPRDWASTYLMPDGEEQIYRYSLKCLCWGRIEHFEGKNFFHEQVV